jgi:hypothetical protein
VHDESAPSPAEHVLQVLQELWSLVSLYVLPFEQAEHCVLEVVLQVDVAPWPKAQVEQVLHELWSLTSLYVLPFDHTEH